jgi:hypothetical protein
LQHKGEVMKNIHVPSTTQKENEKKLRFRFAPKSDGNGIKILKHEPQTSPIIDKLKELTGAENIDAIQALIACAVIYEDDTAVAARLNVLLQTLAECSPKDLNESRLCLQASNLFAEGMRYLQKANETDRLIFAEFYMKSAIKLLRLHNETIDSLIRYRRGGEQKIFVQHNVLAGQAIVNNIAMAGAEAKNEGETPCSTNYAAQKPDQTAISHAASQPWPMESAGCMEEKAPARKRRKEKNN